MPRPSVKDSQEKPIPSSGKESVGDAHGKRITMRDIAQQLGISHVTVSYALRGLPRVSANLRKRICEEAKRLGYRPDPMLRALSAYRRVNSAPVIRASLAWLCCWDSPEKMRKFREFHSYWLGVKDVAERHGYRLEEFVPSPQLSISRIQQIMRARGIQGVLIPPPQGTFGQKLDAFDWSGFAVVKFGHSHPGLAVSLVTSAHSFNAILAMNRMTTLGYRRIGFVITDYARVRTQFLGGVLRAQSDLPEKNRVPFLCLADTPRDSTLLKEWLCRERPDAVLTNDRQVPAMLRVLGVRVPQDIGLAVLSIHDGNASAGIDQNPLEIGKAACETVVSLILHGSLGAPAHPRELLVEGSWVDGPSLPPRHQKQSLRRPRAGT